MVKFINDDKRLFKMSKEVTFQENIVRCWKGINKCYSIFFK